MNFRDAEEAFNEAIETNQLSNNQNETNYAGNFMYMHSNEDLTVDYFKHIDTRKYKEIKVVKKK